MKVLQLEIQHFKKFENFSMDFTDPVLGIPKDLVVLAGHNGKGKSTVLQAIALVLGMATGRLTSAEKLDWPGFDCSLATNTWKLPTQIKLRVAFGAAEIETIQRCYKTLPSSKNLKIAPDSKREIVLTLDGTNLSAPSAKQRNQFFGRRYASQVLKLLPEGHEIFQEIGSVFWYHEQRLANTLTPIEEESGDLVSFNDEYLRIYLDRIFSFHARIQYGAQILQPGQKDLFKDIQLAWETVFPGHRLVGSVPREGDRDLFKAPWFFFSDGRHQYELGELSAGERVILPILIDFVRLNIHNSVILIDEIELHLHPPLQQTLLMALQKMGRNNQFIITSHSQAIGDVVPDHAIMRITDG